MKSHRRLLEKIDIASPCSADWNEMSGDDRVRFCDGCSKHVYNISRMTQRQAERLLASTNGKLCARFERRPDGTIITESEPVSFNPFRRIASPVASALIATTLSLTANASTRIASQKDRVVSALSISESPAKSDDGQKNARLRITVFDTTGAVIAEAKVTITNESTGTTQTAVSSEVGECTFSSLEAGSYGIRIEAPYFINFKKDGLVLQAGSDVYFASNLQVDTNAQNLGVVVFVEGVEIDPAPERSKKLVKPIKKRRFVDCVLYATLTGCLKSPERTPFNSLGHRPRTTARV